MLIAFVIILMVVGLAIIGALYSLFGPFLGQLADIRQYNMAYYSALSSVERGMLTLRYHGPGFEGESGVIDGILTGNQDDTSIVSGGDSSWKINSRTTSIPAEGMGNTPFVFRESGGDSENYNALRLDDLFTYSFDVDTTTDSSTYYDEPTSRSRGSLNNVNLYMRLPPFVKSAHNGVGFCVSGIGCDKDGDGVSDDVVANRSIEGYHRSISRDRFFRINPRLNVHYLSGVVMSNDSMIRESDIGNVPTAQWGSPHHRFNPVVVDSAGTYASSHNMVIAPANVAPNPVHQPFSSLFTDASVVDLSLVLGLSRDLEVQGGRVYPYIETRLEANAPIADSFYHLDGMGRVGEYDVQIYVKKPTSDRSLLGSFTVVF